ncbi:phenylalanine--tRNA ligase subunit alpha [Candidatus Riesia pediculicola]|uniref:phenylalanine--tRNA ligase n=1 Tax=Riesia pediculicola (strain USDA) TaxID=515618 RepID=D4G7Q9_RIEPU|nr:phenylalanine--tRNA ligase subunit alpha [Candidatus Riesia pediculicola]ADD79749.1 phenylalanyl-tRNA synthetase [Candidatus Riesia pediculicola USDA]ARC53632.1 hypothetical protein AOE55_00470 [Candidatus Riesia pediculicola]QOJ86283.1 phenylalanine--tRNA ligase subunit alpha [Candidatus Riesia pediculicola]
MSGKKSKKIDITLSGRKTRTGSIHLITQAFQEIRDYFFKLGFSSEEGPEIENEKNNFDFLNIPKDHPDRRKQSTFWIDQENLLRTQISCIQVRSMKKRNPPVRIISSGKVYRKDYDQNHTPMFHQTDGFIIEKLVNFIYLRDILVDFLKSFFKRDIETRLRSSYFPFTEPSMEIDVLDVKGNWIEVIGCGMMHPKILSNIHINSQDYSGLAFGIGVDRIVTIRHEIPDIRILFENDLRFLKQF